MAWTMYPWYPGYGWGWRGKGRWGWPGIWPGRGPFSYLPPWQRPGWIYGRGACWWLYGYPYMYGRWSWPATYAYPWTGYYPYMYPWYPWW